MKLAPPAPTHTPTLLAPSPYYTYRPARSFVSIGSWEAHTEPILTMNLVAKPPTVITAAMDRLVKVRF